MRTAALKRSAPYVHIRAATLDDLDALMTLEQSVFAADCMARKNLKRFLSVTTAEVLIADCDGQAVGCAIVSYRNESERARLYSLAVIHAVEGCGVAAALLDAAEASARTRRCRQMRLEVHEYNARAIACYCKAGYREFERRVGYYKDLGDALRFCKDIV